MLVSAPDTFKTYYWIIFKSQMVPQGTSPVTSMCFHITSHINVFPEVLVDDLGLSRRVLLYYFVFHSKHEQLPNLTPESLAKIHSE